VGAIERIGRVVEEGAHERGGEFGARGAEGLGGDGLLAGQGETEGAGLVPECLERACVAAQSGVTDLVEQERDDERGLERPAAMEDAAAAPADCARVTRKELRDLAVVCSNIERR
jgi:hypothetical protein